MQKKVTFGGLLLSAAMIFSYIEHLIPLDFIAPGVKLGLANCVFLLTVMTLGPSFAVSINLIRIFLTALLFSNPVSLVFSLAGAAASMTITIILYKLKFISPSGIGAVSGIAHNLAQLAAAAVVTGSLGVFWYSPVLILSGTVCGFSLGAASSIIKKRVKKYF